VVVGDDRLPSVLRTACRRLHGRPVHFTHARARFHRGAIHRYLPSVPQGAVLHGDRGSQDVRRHGRFLPRPRFRAGNRTKPMFRLLPFFVAYVCCATSSDVYEAKIWPEQQRERGR